MQNLSFFKGLLLTVAIFIILYWIGVFGGIFPVEELVAGYRNWFMSFPIPDFYIAVCAFLAWRNVGHSNSKTALFATMAGSGLIFLGLYGFAYGVNTGLLFILTTDEIIEIIIKLSCLSAGSYFVSKSWQLIKP